MLKVKRHLINDETWELPAGGGLENEMPVETARRELAEETGIHIRDLTRFRNMFILSEMPGRSTELLLTFTVEIGRDEFDSRYPCDEEEITDLRAFSIGELKRAIAGGEIYVSSPIAIISRYIFENDL
jgi:ADP-ribose pyrophosphatase